MTEDNFIDFKLCLQCTHHNTDWTEEVWCELGHEVAQGFEDETGDDECIDFEAFE